LYLLIKTTKYISHKMSKSVETMTFEEKETLVKAIANCLKDHEIDANV